MGVRDLAGADNRPPPEPEPRWRLPGLLRATRPLPEACGPVNRMVSQSGCSIVGTVRVPGAGVCVTVWTGLRLLRWYLVMSLRLM